MKKVLFIPAQVGIAHHIRCQAVAIELHKLGYQCHIATEDSTAGVLPPAPGIHKHVFSAPRLVRPEIIDDYTKKRFSSEAVKRYVDGYRAIIDAVDPVMVVVDNELFGLVAASTSNRPHALIVNALMLPFRRGVAGEELHHNPIMQKAKNTSGLITNAVLRNMIQSLLNKYSGRHSLSVDEILASTPIILPEWKGYVHLRTYLDNFHYVGPILNPLIETREPNFERKIISRARGKSIIYLSFGGTGFSVSKLRRTTATLAEAGYFVVVSTGALAEASDIQVAEHDGYVAKFVPGISATSIADCVVTHCSQGTVVQAILAGKPIVGVPFNLDQMVHAYKIEEFKIGINTHRLKLTDLIKNVYDSKWVTETAKSIPETTILDAVKELVKNPAYRSNLAKISNRFGTSTDGAAKAAALIHMLANNQMPRTMLTDRHEKH